MGLRRVKVAITTNASGDGTGTAPALVVMGHLYAIHWLIGTCAAGVDVTISTAGADGAKTLLTLTDANSSALYYPRDAKHSETGAALTATLGGDRELPLTTGRPTVVIAQGGDTKTGYVIFYYLVGE